MALTAAALADLRSGLRFAAKRYRAFASMQVPTKNAELFLLMAVERQGDADDIERASDSTELPPGNPIINEETAEQVLGMGGSDGTAAATAASRVQRGENMLGRMAVQLWSLAPKGRIRDALGRVRDHIDYRRAEVRIARQRTVSVSKPSNSASIGKASVKGSTAGQQVLVWFGTNRRRDARSRFSGARSDEVSYGQCRVFVPNHRAVGSIGRGFLGRMIWGDDRIKLERTDILSEGQFWSSLASDVDNLATDEKHGLVFLHGYNTKFANAAIRTAQLKVDLAHKGPAAFFSWPSLGYPAGYTGDEAAIEGSEIAIQNFLVAFARRSRASAVHIIAHSMGNRGLSRAMAAIANVVTGTPVRFGQVFLAAPDIDAQLFQSLAAAYGQISTRATLYVTSNDKAMGLSRRWHRYTRVGLAPPITVLPGIDTIDASHVNLGLLGHSYAAEMRPVLADIHRLIQADTAPDKRFGLRRASRGKAGHWEFSP